MPANPLSLEDLTVDCLTENVRAFVASFSSFPELHQSSFKVCEESGLNKQKKESAPHMGWRQKIAQRFAQMKQQHEKLEPAAGSEKDFTDDDRRHSTRICHPFFLDVEFEPMADLQQSSQGLSGIDSNSGTIHSRSNENVTDSLLTENSMEGSDLKDEAKMVTPFPAFIGDKLLASVHDKGLIADRTMELFQKKYVDLERINLSHCDITDAGLRVLNQHNLTEVGLRYCTENTLDIGILCVTILNKTTKEKTLRVLDLTGTLTPSQPVLFEEESKGNDNSSHKDGQPSDQGAIELTVKTLTSFRQLAVLKVAFTEFDDRSLALICDSPINRTLQLLDISGTEVMNIDPIRQIDKLSALIMHRLSIRQGAPIETLVNFGAAIEVLDISGPKDISKEFLKHAGEEGGKYSRLAVYLIEALSGESKIPKSQRNSDDFMDTAAVFAKNAVIETKIAEIDLKSTENAGKLRKLRVLDISGSPGIFDTKCFGRFLQSHGELEFLGVLMTNVGNFFAGSDDVVEMDEIQVAGEATSSQIVCALQTYSMNNRESFCSRSLYNAFNEFHHRYDQFSREQLRTLLYSSMCALKTYPKDLSVQMAGTACLYNLCTKDRATEWDANDLKLIVNNCLDAAENHPTTIQLHKNVWLTICNDHVLQADAIDMYRCCCVALESMCANSNSAITRMTVAIVSILAAKVPTTKMWKVGNSDRYMRFLVGVLRQKVAEWEETVNNLPQNAPPPVPDVTLKFTLSALWNLTDESPCTCRQFLRQRGMDTVLEILEKFPSNSIRTKVLGLLNNVAEVAELRHHLLTEKCLSLMLVLLSETKIDVSYFSAGVLANLGAVERWSVEPDWDTCMMALVDRISSWEAPETEMVAYRSFRPFFPLLERVDNPGVQLWAVWAIRHICLRNAERYMDMFLDQGGVDAVATIKRNLDGVESLGIQLNRGQIQVREIAEDILNNMIG